MGLVRDIVPAPEPVPVLPMRKVELVACQWCGGARELGVKDCFRCGGPPRIHDAPQPTRSYRPKGPRPITASDVPIPEPARVIRD